MIRRSAVLFVLAAAVFVSAILVVRAAHRARDLQHELQVLRVERDRLTTEWAQLRLEESTWANPDRVARIARKRLDMHQPSTYVPAGAQP